MILRNFLFYSILAVWTAAMPFVLLYFVLRGEKFHIAARRTNHLYGTGWRWCIRPWASLDYSGPAKEAFPAPCILAVNHQSFFDIHCIGQTPHGNVTFTVRSWPFKLPFYGAFMRLGRYTDVQSLPHETVLERLKADAADKSVIVFFPEAHRNPAPNRDETPNRFHAGAFAAALALDLPVVPVCIQGTGTVLPPGTPWIRPGAIRVRVLPPVYPAAFREHGERAASALRKHVQAAMRQMMQTQI